MSENSRKLNALVRLGIARQAPPDEATQQVYLEELQHWPSDIVEIACQKIARLGRAEFEPAYPTVGRIISDCRDVVRQQGIITDTSRLLTRPDIEPLTRDEARTWIGRFKASVQQRRKRETEPAPSWLAPDTGKE